MLTMALTSAYLISNKNVKPLFDSLIGAKAPDAFTQKFIENLGFKSTNDRLYIPVLKGLGFLDDNAAPTDRYFKFLDQSESKKILAEAIEDAYADLFAINTKAQELDLAEVKNKLRSLTQGKHSEKVVSLMAATFKALSEYAEWGHKKHVEPPRKVEEKPQPEKPEEEPKDTNTTNKPSFEKEEDFGDVGRTINKPDFHYNIQIHLPDSRDESVYDAIFKSLKRHLL